MRLCKLALVFGVVALLASPALAQPGRGGFGGPGMLLRVEKVQKDLKIDKEKADKIETALTKVRDDLKDEFAKVGRGSTASDDEKAAARKKITEANEKVIKEYLSEKQEDRLKQIQRQLAGIDMFGQEDVQKKVKLTDDQKEKIKEINTDLQKEMRELFSGGFKPENIAKVQTMRKEAMSSAVKLLTDDQKKQVKELVGEPLELKLEDLFPGGKPGGKPRDF